MSPLFSNFNSKIISKAQRNYYYFYRRFQRYGQLSIISYDYYAGVGKFCIRIFKNGRSNLTCSEY